MKDKISIIICTYNDNVEIFEKCLKSTVNQKNIEKEILVVDMSTNDTIKKICLKYVPDVQYNFYPQSIGLSDSRNRGFALAKNHIVAFLDADAIPEEQWAYNLHKAFYQQDKVAIVGGKISPLWSKNPNALFKHSNQIKAFLSLLDLGNKIKETSRIFGGNSAINKKFIATKKIFNTKLGRIKKKLVGGEETDLCIKCQKEGYKIIYTPLAEVKHYIPSKRMKLKWIIKKAYYDGLSRGLKKNKPQPMVSEYNIYDFIFLSIILVPYLIGQISARIRK